MKKIYQKKPVKIEAVQWTGKNRDEIINFVGEELIKFSENNTLIIKTLEGEHISSLDDFIIKGVKGEYYACKPDIFEMTYSEVKDENINH